MKRIKLIFTFLVGLFIFSSCEFNPSTNTSSLNSNTSSSEASNQDELIFTSRQSVLLLGQSNMAGRGNLNEVEAISDERIFMIRDGAWQKMAEPIHNDKAAAGVGLAASFAKGFVETFNCELGLIPGAFGGTSISQWSVGGTYYNRALEMAKVAQKDSTICAILWHQGESNQNNSENYANKLQVVLDSFISDLNLDKNKIVIVAGELGEFRQDSKENIHAELAKLKSVYERFDIASAKGLTAQDVTTHFSAASLRVFGYRYFDIFYHFITGKHYEFVDDPKYYFVGDNDDDDDTDPSLIRFEMEGTIVEDTYVSAMNAESKAKNYSTSGTIGTNKNASRPLFKFSFENILSFGDFATYKDTAKIEFKFSVCKGMNNITDDITCNAYGFLPKSGVGDASFETLTWNTCSSSGENSSLYRGNANFIFKDTRFADCSYISKTNTHIKYSFPFNEIEKFINLEKGDTYGYAVFGFDFNASGVNFASMENTDYDIPMVDFVYYKQKNQA